MNILLESEKIREYLPYDINIIVLEKTTSTNDYFCSVESAQSMNIQCCVAEQQTHGRGRQNRVWTSPFGKNIYLSCYYPLQKNIHELSGLSLVVGLSIVKTLHALDLCEAQVKWPNDILYHGKKMAGILVDLQTPSCNFSPVVIGIGLNVNMQEKDNLEITQSWTSLCEESQNFWNRNEVIGVLLKHLLEYMQRFEQQGFTAFQEEWSSVDALINKKITLNHINHAISGTVVGIDHRGFLLMRLADGNIQAFSSGEASLVKV